MLKERSRLLQRLLFVADLGLIAVAWVLAWVIRFEVLTPPEWIPLTRYLAYLPGVLVVWGAVFLLSGLYRTRRAQRLPLVVFSVARAVFFGLIASVAAVFFYREFSFSRLHMLTFGVLTSTLLVLLRLVIYAVLHRARQQGKNLRRVLVVGAGRAGQRLANAFRQYPWMGFEVVGFLDDHAEAPDVLGTLDDLIPVMDRLAAEDRGVDLVYLCLPSWAGTKIEALIDAAATRLAHICLVPDLFQFEMILNSRVSDIDGLPIIHLIDETPFDFRRVVKRSADIAFAAVVVLLLAPLFLVIAAAVKLSSPGPVFYRQERMGLNGRTFQMLKFRSMPVNAEAGTGAVWARPGENRATPVGAFLRRTSLDELPQFLNVLWGDMSVVGPRPERPIFIEEFKTRVPHYMLRHKVKAGITGWAQVNGWRGNTSIEKRIECDLYYIQHWSLWLDVKIVFLTLFKGFVHENAY
ncbi:MAG: undecaprenyl-phosphate glucose phosphotransferase [Rhodothermales bacterium]